MDKQGIDAFLQHSGIHCPVICGAMYPCSNPHLIAAVSQAGGLGVIQPIALTYVHGYEFSQGVRLIKSLTDRPLAMNALIEKSSKKYYDKMLAWVDQALELGIGFFITSLGNPKWVVEKVHAAGGYVYHDVTEPKWAEKGLAAGVDGLIAVNNRAGGHAGGHTMQSLYTQLKSYGVPVIAAGGISEPEGFSQALQQGYAGVQMGTRFIATIECTASDAYKRAIVDAGEKDIALTQRITGVPVSVILTEYVKKQGLSVGPLSAWFLRHRKTKHITRLWYVLRSLRLLKKSLSDDGSRLDYWQAGKSVAGIDAIKPVSDIMSVLDQAFSKL